MKYTAEEVRAIAKRLHDDITVADGDALMASDMLTELAERIEASEGVVPVAYQSKRRPEDYPDEWRECSKETFDTIKRMKDSPWIVRELFTAQSAQDAAEGLTQILNHPAAPVGVPEMLGHVDRIVRLSDGSGFIEIAFDGVPQYHEGELIRLTAPSAPPDFPECSGSPASCPENEGYGCCKPNPSAPQGVE